MWRVIPRYPLYEASIEGLIRKRGNIHCVTQTRHPAGYLSVNIGQHVLVHRLVAFAHLPEPVRLNCIVGHIDNDKTNNHASNLQWITRGQNTKDAYTDGLIPRDTRSVKQFTLDGKFVREYKSVTDAARAVGARPGNVANCCRGERRHSAGFVFTYSEERKAPDVLEGEDWKTVSVNPAYEVSSHGRVRNRATGRHLSLATVAEYKQVILSVGQDHNKGLKMKVHKLVATEFVPNPNNLPIIDHKDNNKTNNHFQNLQWITHSGNTAKSVGVPIIQLYPDSKTAKQHFASQKAAADAVGCSIQAIAFAVKNRSLCKGFYWIKRWQMTPSDLTVVDMDCS